MAKNVTGSQNIVLVYWKISIKAISYMYNSIYIY